MKPPGNSAGLPSREEFDGEAYLAMHPDVAAAVDAGAVGSGWQHFILHGAREGRRWQSKSNRTAGIDREIADKDEMFGGDPAHYFDAGESALRCIEAALMLAGRPADSIRQVLDLPCGHGRVLRFLRRAFPTATLTACDLNRDGVDFCAARFGAVPVQSDRNPSAIKLPDNFDLIWCGSLLTHLERKTCEGFFGFFHRVLSPGGIAVITLHGRHHAEELATGRRTLDLDKSRVESLLATYRKEGFGYVNYAGHADYGFSLTDPAFVMAKFLPLASWRLLGYMERGWDRRQDVLILQKAD